MMAMRLWTLVAAIASLLPASAAIHLLNSGGAYRLTPTQQIDFRIGLGLNRNAPNWVFGLGYSIRRDGLF
jgi:Putative MetA-pathway of phenol degradation